MAKARQIVKRRKAVTNIRKITKTMQLIATARFQQAFNRATATKPYTEMISKLVGELAAAAGGQIEHPLMKENPEADAGALLVITSNRGLCGGYNSRVLHAAINFLNTAAAPKIETTVVGKKGINYFKFLRRPVEKAITTIDDKPRFEQVEPIAAEYMRRYIAGELRGVHIAYMKFISTGKQVPEVMRLLPLTKIESTVEAGPKTAVEYDFSPEPAKLLESLLPQTVKVRMYQCFTDAAVSEQVARMVAMKSATDAAGDMIKQLTRDFNRARQSQITLELLDIVGGAEVLK